MAVPRPSEDPVRAVTLHSSWRGIGSAAATPLVLLALGGATIAARGVFPVPVALVVLGAGLAVIVLVDYPLSARFDDSGVRRRCLLRRPLLPWQEIEVLERASGSRLRPTRARPRREGGGRLLAAAPGGLVARRRGHRYLLVDQPESQDEHDALVRLIARVAPGVEIQAARPPSGTPPTWVYRRRGPS